VLAQRGYYKGRIDDKMGPETRRAIREFQRNQGLPVSGHVDSATIGALKLNERR
jgi:peptidoglycan hydrolase-like protein with peptidoglycan-binding domain